MSRSLYRAWRFVHPDLDPGQSGLGLAPQGGVQMVDGNDTVRQAVLLLLSTRPGERVMRPEYGCDVQRVLFAPNDDTTAALAIYYVRRALIRWEPRIDIVTLDAQRADNDLNFLIIKLEYQVRATRAVEQIELALDLSGGGG